MGRAVLGVVDTLSQAEKSAANLQEAGFVASDISVVGRFVAEGPILAAVSGAPAAAVLDGASEVLVDLGISELEALLYASKIKKEKVLVAVRVVDDLKRKVAESILLENGAESVSAVTEATF